MKKGIVLIALISLCAFTYAQDKDLTVRDAVIGQWMELRPEQVSGVVWKGQTPFFTYRKNSKVLQQVDARNGNEEELFNLKQVNTILQENDQGEIRSLRGYSWLDEETILLKNGNNYYRMLPAQNKLSTTITYDKDGANPDFSAEANAVAYTIDNNLYLATPDNPKIAVTTHQDPEIISGQEVSRREFNIGTGTFWSPEGNFLAFYEKDVSDVWSYPIPDLFQRPAARDSIKYPMAGSPSEHVSLGVLNRESGEIIYIEREPESEKYLTNITWGPEEKYLYIAVLNRDQDHMKMNQYDARTGEKVKTLFEEKSDRYVEPYHNLLFLEANPERFIYQTEQITGFSHLFLYTAEGKRIRQLTKGEWVVTNVLGFDENEEFVFITATKETPLEQHVYKVALKDGEITRLTKEAGMHRAKLSAHGGYFFDQYSSKNLPNKATIRSTSGELTATMLEASNPLKSYGLGEMEIGSLKAADGKTDLHYRLIKPEDFNPDKQYPAIVYVYGGPHAQLVENSWLGGAALWNFYMAQEGYVMLTLDNRGSANRGYEFESTIYRQAGQKEMADQMRGVKMLQDLKYVDNARIGVHGWSYGGFMTTSLMVNHPRAFKAAVAGGPVIDWKFYEVMYGERYMDTPQSNPEGYKKTSLLHRASDLEDPLLIIQGGVDPVVVMQHSIQFIQKCIEAGKPIDYFIYPKSEHNMRGDTRVHLKKKITDYFNLHLK